MFYFFLFLAQKLVFKALPQKIRLSKIILCTKKPGRTEIKNLGKQASQDFSGFKRFFGKKKVSLFETYQTQFFNFCFVQLLHLHWNYWAINVNSKNCAHMHKFLMHTIYKLAINRINRFDPTWIFLNFSFSE